MGIDSPRSAQWDALSPVVSPALSASLLGALNEQSRPIHPVGRRAPELRRWLASSARLETSLDLPQKDGILALVAEDVHDLDQLRELHPHLDGDARVWIAVEPQSARQACVASPEEIGTWLSALHARGFATLSARPLAMCYSADGAGDWATLPLYLRYVLGAQLLLIARPVPTGQAAYREQDVQRWLREGRASKALHHCASVLRLDPGAPQAKLWWARALLAAGRVEDATEALRDNVRRWPGDREAWRLMERIRDEIVLEGEPASPWIARHWLRLNAPKLVGPILDIGSEPEQRSWLSSWGESCRIVAPEGEDIVEMLSELPSGSFGSAVAWEPFVVTDRRVVLLEELLRVVRPGGQLLLVGRQVRASALKTVLEELGATCLEVEQLAPDVQFDPSLKRGLCMIRATRHAESSLPRERPSSQLYVRASEHLAAGQHDRALVLGQRLLAERPLDHAGYLATAAAWERLGCPQRADGLLMRGLEQQDDMLFCMRLASALATLELLRR